MIYIKNQKEMEKYYDEKTNTYVFNEHVRFYCNIDIKSNIRALYIIAEETKINALNIYARDIRAFSIKANYINAEDIKAVFFIKANFIKAWAIIADSIDVYDISYIAMCIAYSQLRCKKIECKDGNGIHRCLCEDIKFINDNDEE